MPDLNNNKMSNRILGFNLYTESISESAGGTYSLDQISNALDEIESNITEYFYVSNASGLSLTYDRDGDDVVVTPEISSDADDHSYGYDSSLSRDVIRNLVDEDDGEKPRFTDDVIKDAIDSISDNAEYYIKGIDTSSVDFQLDINHHGSDEIRISVEVDEGGGSGIEVVDFDFSEWKSDVIQEITKSISGRLLGG